jgi:hypothetical protein
MGRIVPMAGATVLSLHAGDDAACSLRIVRLVLPNYGTDKKSSKLILTASRNRSCTSWRVPPLQPSHRPIFRPSAPIEQLPQILCSDRPLDKSR